MALEQRAELKSGDRVRVVLGGWGRLGEATADIDGRRVFVMAGIPGEDVVIEVLRRRRDYVSARVVEVLAASPHRVAAPCPFFGDCTGCELQHISYPHQLEMKAGVVADALQRIAGMEADVKATLPAPSPLGYRNHARFTVDPKGNLGFVNRETRRFVPVDRCLLMHEGVNRIMAELNGRAGETAQLSVRYGVNTGDHLVQPRFHNPEITVASGQTHYTERMWGKAFRVASPSFFQVNTVQAERLMELVREQLALTGSEVVVDAYAGVGTIAVLLAPHAKQVIAIEESSSAVHDAEANAAAAGLTNVRFMTGRTEDTLLTLDARPDAVVLDPPRTGCEAKALEALIALRPSRVVYVSCDPATLARDIKLLTAGPFELVDVQPVDMFPQTHHIECVAALRLKPHIVDAPIVLASTSPRRRELLGRVGLPFTVVAPEVDETPLAGEMGIAQAVRLAIAKARAGAKQVGHGLVIGSDTVVVAPGGRILGKPRDAGEAREMLALMRGQRHVVVTGVAAVDAATGRMRVTHQTTGVWMRMYTDANVETYIASGDPFDKAGAYAVQDKVFRPASLVEGCLLTVVGLPLCAVRDLLLKFGYWTPPDVVPQECRPASR